MHVLLCDLCNSHKGYGRPIETQFNERKKAFIFSAYICYVRMIVTGDLKPELVNWLSVCACDLITKIKLEYTSIWKWYPCAAHTTQIQMN